MKSGKFLNLLRIIFSTASTFALVVLTNGCCTQDCLNQARQITIGKFNPSGLYQSETADKFALQGTYCDQKEYGERITSENFFQVPRTNAFLVIAKNKLISRHFSTNCLYSIAEIKTLPPALLESLKPTYKLSASYTKVAEFPTNQVLLIVNEQHPNAGLFIMLPFAFAVDVIAFPIELLPALAFANYHGC